MSILTGNNPSLSVHHSPDPSVDFAGFPAFRGISHEDYLPANRKGKGGRLGERMKSINLWSLRKLAENGV
ncbi:hypothetical protein SAMN02745181_3853 [Rubritalea squalenifaciens DSM 18772]|uniref:Uncharacterized protein n=1 Tax=Rubritalea squalenifaciens DSM 18772 TaxID=1123071 RepID=A0A1M6SPC3_9BACT|nr:hypothetical protein [Rubritalea squalenifaciens]SHK46591.1 hypothetical protein SAMN02745181_3853 [Rubritalea squalenifaciens DSM 18772]